MTSTLVWSQVTTHEGRLPFELKKVISRRLWDTDGSTGGDPVIVDEKLIPYLEGLVHAGVHGAAGLIDLINQHGQVKLWHEH